MMNKLAIVVGLGISLCAFTHVAEGVSVSCMMAYQEGGAPAVFSSPACPQWVHSAESTQNSTRNCQFAMLQGRRNYQEDRVTCNLDVKLPFSDKDEPGEVTVGIAAIFDGHVGAEASELASRKLLDYFSMHVVFNAYRQGLLDNKENHEVHKLKSSGMRLPMLDHHSLHPILEEALLRTIQDIDTKFSKEALDKGYSSGSTAIVVLLVNGQSLVANVGDSKALLCSDSNQSLYEAEDSSLDYVYAEQLTRDHHPDREDEKARIEAAGGFVRTIGVPRVNGMLAVSRAIGDLHFKRYGVIAEPEITGWRPFTPENKYLVVASDGIFETLTPQDVCYHLHHKASSNLSSDEEKSLADRLIRSAYKAGSGDNLSAIVISNFLNNACNNSSSSCEILYFH